MLSKAAVIGKMLSVCPGPVQELDVIRQEPAEMPFESEQRFANGCGA